MKILHYKILLLYIGIFSNFSMVASSEDPGGAGSGASAGKDAARQTVTVINPLHTSEIKAALDSLRADLSLQRSQLAHHDAQLTGVTGAITDLRIGVAHAAAQAARAEEAHTATQMHMARVASFEPRIGRTEEHTAQALAEVHTHRQQIATMSFLIAQMQTQLAILHDRTTRGDRRESGSAMPAVSFRVSGGGALMPHPPTMPPHGLPASPLLTADAARSMASSGALIAVPPSPLMASAGMPGASSAAAGMGGGLNISFSLGGTGTGSTE